MKVKTSVTGLAAILFVGSLWTAPALTQSSAGSGVIAGTVKDAAGSPIEGVIVSARASHETWTTSVYTDRQGSYQFPPLSAGQYSMWAQAKGYDLAKVDASLANQGRITGDFALKPLTDPRLIANQADGPEWYAALPESNDQERRMKHWFRNNCTACHPASFVLGARFDARGWRTIIDFMARGIPPVGNSDAGAGRGNPTWRAYMDEVAEYWGRVTPTLQPKPGPQTTGAATRAIVTEYDIPRQGRSISVHTGTVWTDGPSTIHESKGARDIWVDAKGQLWVSDDRSMGRTTGKLDPRTGKWTDYAFFDEQGVARSSHGLNGHTKTGILFQGGQPDGAILAFDTTREEFLHFAVPPGMPRGGGHIDVDSEGNGWAPATNGVLRLNPKTGEYTYFPIPWPEGVRESDRGTYGIAVDALDNVWLARPGAEMVGWVEPKTGKTGHVRFEPIVMPGLTEQDRTVARGMNAGPPNGRGPRRLGSSGKNGGNYMYVALNKSDEIAQIDIRTKQVVKVFPLPVGSQPYDARVDKNGNVWIPPQNADRVYKIDPRTGQVFTFHLPTRGTDIRMLTVDDNTTPVSIWLTYNRSNKIVRLQERPAATQQTAAR